MEHIKQKLYTLCQAYLDRRIQTAQQAIEAAQQAANNETKSSSGDKYETGRAMMQLEVEKDSAQLSETLKLKHALNQINIELAAASVQAGSLVVTHQAVFFIAISVGKLMVDEKPYLVISPASPLGKELMGLKVNDSFTFNNRDDAVKKIF